MRSSEMLQKILPVLFALVLAIAVGLFLLFSRNPLSADQIDQFAKLQLERCAGAVAKNSAKLGSAIETGQANCKMLLEQPSHSLVRSKITAVSSTRYVISGESKTGNKFSINTEDLLVMPMPR